MRVGDTVQVINPKDPDYGMVGDIISETGVIFYVNFGIGFYSKVSVFEEKELYKLKETDRYPVPRKNQPSGMFPKGWEIDFSTSTLDTHKKCRHVWKDDQYFTATIYRTCTKCGARHEDENDDDFGVPF